LIFLTVPFLQRLDTLKTWNISRKHPDGGVNQ